jgi:hypothetical protein
MPVADEVAEAQLLEGLGGVDQDVAVLLQAGEDIDLMQQGRVLDDDGVGRHDRLAQADLLVGDAAEGHHRGAGALGTETGKGLRVTAFLESRDRQHFRRRHHSLTATAMYAYLEHYLSSVCPREAYPWRTGFGKPCMRNRFRRPCLRAGLRMRLR